MSTGMPAPGECTWTYHPPGADDTPGYWTYVGNCPNGQSCVGTASAEILKDPARFATLVRAKYTQRKSEGRAVELTREAEAALDEYKREPLSARAARTFTMPCVSTTIAKT